MASNKERKKMKKFLTILGFKPQEGEEGIFFKKYPKHDGYLIRCNLLKQSIDYGEEIELGDKTTSNFHNEENFVVLECVDRLLQKGYSPRSIVLENKWLVGRKEKGKLDILIKKKNQTYLMIECKTWGQEYNKEINKMKKDGGQLFSYFQQDKSAKYLCLYTSRVNGNKIESKNQIVEVQESWRDLNNQKEVYEHWNKNFKDNGIFEDWVKPYNVEIKSLVRSRLQEITQEDSSRIFNQFAEILRHNVVSDKPNAFNKILNLFICKIIDEDRPEHEELSFQWKDDDTHESLQGRLNDLYKEGMKRFLEIEVTDYTDEELSNKLYAITNPEIQGQVLRMFKELRLQKNPEFAFKEVFNEQSFEENAIVVKEVVELLQPYQFRYGHKQQFLGNFFEQLLNTSIKQESGQYFTPVPIARFIISCFPIEEFIVNNVNSHNQEVLPYAIDYATGSGHFLTEWMDMVQEIIESIETKNMSPTLKRKFNAWRSEQFGWASEYVYGIEADYRLVKTAKVSSFLNGDGEANIIQANGLDNFQKSKYYRGLLKQYSSDNPQDNKQFDVVIANPPYSVASFKNTLPQGEESFELFNRLTDNSSEIECLFVERTKQLLKVGGRAGVILPSTILTNTGIYTDTREMIYKYFNIVAIVEFGINTFMATNAKTVTLFLERKPNNEWKIVLSLIEEFFKDFRDKTINGIENAIKTYSLEIYKLNLADYITLIKGNPNNDIIEHEIFKEYAVEFGDPEQTKDFYQRVIESEKNKMLYFLLTYKQKTLVVRTGSGIDEKKFLGYEFSERRGFEGIRFLKDEKGNTTSKLYDEKDLKSTKKINSYIYNAFLKKTLNESEIDESLMDHLTEYELSSLIDFNRSDNSKPLSLFARKIDYQSKWESKKLKELCSIQSGLWTSDKETLVDKGVIRSTNFNTEGILNLEEVVEIKVNKEEYKLKNIVINDILLEKSGGSPEQPVGRVALCEENATRYSYGNFISRIRIKSKYEELISPIFLWGYLHNLYLMGETERMQSGVRILNLDLEKYKNIEVPLLPMNLQKKIEEKLKSLIEERKSSISKLGYLEKEMIGVIEKAYKKNQKLIKIGDVFDLNKKSVKPEEVYKDSQFTYVDIKGVGKGTGEVSYNQKLRGIDAPSRAKRVASNDNVIISTVRPYLKGIAHLEEVAPDVVFSTGYSILESKDSNIYKSKLLYFLFMYSDDIMQQIESKMSKLSYPSINNGDIKAMLIPKIPLEEQKNMLVQLEDFEKNLKKIRKDLSLFNEHIRKVYANIF